MAVAMIWGPPGSGKTVAATAIKGTKIKLLCSDNSHVVLKMFDRKNVDIEPVEHWLQPDPRKTPGADPDKFFTRQFENAVGSGEYGIVVADNLTDLKELALQEIEDDGKLKDIRQIYQAVYMALKRLVRAAANANCHVIFTAWSLQDEMTLTDGTQQTRQMPNLPGKIIDQILGLCNVVAYMTHSKNDKGEDVYYCVTAGSETLYGCKDQLFGRKSCFPKDLFDAAKPQGKQPTKSEEQSNG